MLSCSKCEKPVPSGSAFCNRCGTKVQPSANVIDASQEVLTSIPTSSSFIAPPPLLSSVEPKRKNSFLVPLAVGAAIIVALTTARIIYKNNQQKVFLASLVNRKSDVSKEDFKTVCRHKDDCVGRFIVWDGIVDGDAFPGSESFNVTSVNGGAKVYTVEPLPMRLHDGDEVIFHGFLGEVNVLSPDIINTGSVRRVIATAAQLAQKKNDEALAAAVVVPQPTVGISLKCGDPRDANDVRYFYFGDGAKEFFRFESDGTISERVSLFLDSSTESYYTYNCSNLDPNLERISQCSSFTLSRDTLEVTDNQRASLAVEKEDGETSFSYRFACQVLDKSEASRILTARNVAIQSATAKEEQKRADQLSKDKL
jgi:hypothetical protein